MKRRNFFKSSTHLFLALILMMGYSCKENKKKETVEETESSMETMEPFFKLSLAQWSMHNMIQKDGVDPYSFAEKAKSWGFSGLEYVSQLYDDELKAANYSDEAMAAFVERSNAESKKNGLENLIIMIDNQGDLATSDAEERKKGVENHFKWVDAAMAMGCHSIRVNISGSTVPEEWMASAVDGLTQLATYAKDKNINVIVENHGGLSSNAAMLAEIMKKVNMDNCGTLPDFGNFCISKADADNCVEHYDNYKGVTELMPYAKAVSAKSHNFDADGNETEVDYVKLLQIVKDAGYAGYIGVEYEGTELGEEAGIIATKELMLKAAKQLNK